MIIEQHYDEEVLIALLDGDAPDPHLQSCETCKASLNAIRSVTSALHDGAVWDRRELNEEPRRETRDALRAFATSSATEDAAAEPWVKMLLAKPAAEWRATLEAHPEWRTAGFVRKLIASALTLNYSSPADALQLTRLAVAVVATLDAAKYRSSIAVTAAAAWREYAYALEYVGSHGDALDAVNRADQYLADAIVGDYDHARSQLVRAAIYAGMERYSDALPLTRAARRVFLDFGDLRRAVIAEINEAAMLTRMRQFADALPMYLAIRENEDADQVTRTSAIHNAAVCYKELGRIATAKQLFTEAVAAYDRLGLTTFRARARWQFAGMLVAEGEYKAAITLLAEVRSEFDELGMAHELALAAIDQAEALLLDSRTSEVAALCREAIAYFSKADLAYSLSARTALAYLAEAASAQELTLQDIGNVRAFFEVLPKQPRLLFARPA